MAGKWMVTLAVVVLAPQIALAQERESTLFLGGTPTVQELIEALEPTRSIIIAPVDQDPLKVVENPSPDVTVTDVGLRVQFAFDSAELTEDARAELDIFAMAMASDELKDSLFVVEGHTDSIGAETYNQKLSELRAQEARRYLVERHDIATDRLIAIGVGERRPLPGQPADASDNRRVHFATAWHREAAVGVPGAEPGNPN